VLFLRLSKPAEEAVEEEEEQAEEAAAQHQVEAMKKSMPTRQTQR
jgi:hypothetical protein